MAEWLEGLLKNWGAAGSLLVYLPAFALGVLFSFTPCVYPILPVVVSVVTANANGKVGRAFALAMTYAVGMSLVYATLGVTVAVSSAASSERFGEWVNNPYVLFAVANVFVLMGLWLMDVVAIPLPGFMSTHRASGSGGFGATFFTGMVSGLVVGPCTGPGLVLILGLINQAAAKAGEVTVGVALYGGGMMFAFGIGMSALLVGAATFSGLLTALPKPGGWMNKVKIGLGAVLILVGELAILYMGVNAPLSRYTLFKGMSSIGAAAGSAVGGNPYALFMAGNVLLILAAWLLSRGAEGAKKVMAKVFGVVVLLLGEALLLGMGVVLGVDFDKYPLLDKILTVLGILQ